MAIKPRTNTPSPAAAQRTSSFSDFRSQILNQNQIHVQDTPMSDQQWATLAFSLGIPARQGYRFNAESSKLAQRMQKKKIISPSQSFDLFSSFFKTLVSSHAQVSQQERCNYHNDAVPTLDMLKNTIHRLPNPRPVISIGYSRDAFSVSHDELQQGIITDPSGEPHDLSHVSQPVQEHFWPFFVVEISDKSLDAALDANALTAATCNHALTLLTEAARNDKAWHDTSLSGNEKSSRTFSLSIHGKVAALSAHGPQDSHLEVSSVISIYHLDDPEDVASLADRINSILIWARFSRLPTIASTLDELDRKVHGNLSGLTIVDSAYDFDPHCLKTLKLQPPRRPDRLKVALKAGLPAWLKAM